MPKVLETISNIFSRNKSSQLETDAVPVEEGRDHNRSRDPSPLDNTTISTYPDNLALVAQNGNPQNQISSPGLYNSATENPTNNILAVNNTQGQVVYQFSHIKGLHMGSVYHINTGKESNSDEKQRRRKTETVHAMMRCEEQLSRKMLDCVSTHLGEGWQGVMRELKFSEGQIHQAKVDYIGDGGLKEVIYQLLLDWSRNDDNGTLGKITQILWKADHFDTVNNMKRVWKIEKNSSVSQNNE